MVYKRVQKKSSSSSPTFTNEASKSKFRQPSFGIQPQTDTDSTPQEIPTNSQGTHKHRSTNLLSKVLANIQHQALTETQPSQLEPEAQADEVSHEAIEIQHQDESGDEDSNSANDGTIQRACSECQSEPEEEKTSSAPPQFYTVQRQSKYLHQKPPIQAKLTIGASGDKYEQEADSMAARVMSMDTPTTHPQTIQRQGEEQHESIQQQPPVSPFVQRVGELIQRMAEVKASTDETVVNSNKEPLFTTKQDNLESTQLEYLQPKHINRVNARPGTEAIYLDNRSHTETGNTEELAIQPLTDEMLQRSGNSDATSATPSLESRLGSQTGGGSPLDEQTRSFMESGFGADFSQVKVHTDTTAVQMNKELGAQAFTHGHDVYFGEGKAPGKNELTAHELTHVVQQGGALRLNKEPLAANKKLTIQQAPEKFNQELRLNPLSNFLNRGNRFVKNAWRDPRKALSQLDAKSRKAFRMGKDFLFPPKPVKLSRHNIRQIADDASRFVNNRSIKPPKPAKKFPHKTRKHPRDLLIKTQEPAKKFRHKTRKHPRDLLIKTQEPAKKFRHKTRKYPRDLLVEMQEPAKKFRQNRRQSSKQSIEKQLSSPSQSSVKPASENDLLSVKAWNKFNNLTGNFVPNTASQAANLAQQGWNGFNNLTGNFVPNTVSQAANLTGNFGTDLGEQAQKFWAEQIAWGEQKGGFSGGAAQAVGYTGGALSSLWTKDTAVPTAVTLATAGLGPSLGAAAQAGELGALSQPILALMKGGSALGTVASAVSLEEAAKGVGIGGNQLGTGERWQQAILGGAGVYTGLYGLGVPLPDPNLGIPRNPFGSPGVRKNPNLRLPTAHDGDTVTMIEDPQNPGRYIPKFDTPESGTSTPPSNKGGEIVHVRNTAVNTDLTVPSSSQSGAIASGGRFPIASIKALPPGSGTNNTGGQIVPLDGASTTSSQQGGAIAPLKNIPINSGNLSTLGKFSNLNVSNLNEVRHGLEDIRSHLTKNDFVERAKKPTGEGKVKTTNDKDVPAKQVVHLEPLPTSQAPNPITIVEVLDSHGKVIGKLKQNSVNGYGSRWNIPIEPPIRLRLTRQDNSTFEWISGSIPPSGYRFGITPTKDIRQSGFYGGHTRDTWNETQSNYSDIIRITKQDKLAFVIPGQKKPIEVSMIRYQVRGEQDKSGTYNWKDVNSPKSIFEGSGNTSILAFEKYMAPYVAQQIQKAPVDAQVVPVDVPIATLNGKLGSIRIQVARQPDKTGATVGKIKSWWVDQNNMMNPDLAIPQSTSSPAPTSSTPTTSSPAPTSSTANLNP